MALQCGKRSADNALCNYRNAARVPPNDYISNNQVQPNISNLELSMDSFTACRVRSGFCLVNNWRVLIGLNICTASEMEEKEGV